MSEYTLCYGCMEQKESHIDCPYCGYRENTPYNPDYLAPGTMLRDRYLIGVLLGYNGEGATYLGYDTTICCKVLIREYMPVGLCARVKGKATISVNYNHLAQYKALMAEYTELNKSLAKMRSLNHINPILDLLAENNTTYTVYEYIEGIKLVDFLKDNAGELPWTQVKDLFPPLFTTLSLIHNAGVVHRAISPETIYVTDKGTLQISGFCIAAVRTADTELKAEMYPGYAAPEQYAASSRQGTWTDVYGICAVLYRILTGCMPIEAPSRLDNDNLCAPNELNSNVPVKVSRIIMEGLELDSNARVQTITELVTRLFEAMEEETAQLHAVAPPPQPPRRREPPVAPKRPVQPELVYDEEEAIYEEAPAVSTFDKIKAPVIIGVLLFALILIVFVILLKMFDQSERNSIDISSTGSTVDMVVPVSATDTSSEVYDSIMPNLVGKYFEAKKADLASTGWIILEGEEVYNDKYEPGMICEQSLAEGEQFKSGTTIKVKVSLGPAVCKVPDFKGVRIAEYEQKLKALGITFKSQKKVNQNVASGYVISTSIEPGKEIDRTQTHELIVVYADNPVVTTAPQQTTTHTTTAANPVTDNKPKVTTQAKPPEQQLPGIEGH